jgi:hypothetical protein
MMGIDDVPLTRIATYLALLLAALLFFRYLTSLFLLALVIATAVTVNTFNLRKFGVETATLATVVLGAAYGATWGAVFGFIAVLLQLLIGQYLDIYVLWVIPGYVLLGLAAGSVTGPITTLGITLTIGLNIYNMLFTALFNPQGLTYYFPYAGFNIVLNIVLFTMVAPSLLGILT